MVSSAIKINGVLGSNSSLALGSLVTLTNFNDSGVTSWLWSLVTIPPGSSASLSGATTATATFTPDIAGSYLIQLTVNGVISDSVIGAVKTPILSFRIPATQESDEFDEGGNTSGWSAAIHEALTAIDNRVNLRYTSLAEQSSDPTAVANRGLAYTKDNSGKTDLFYRDSSGSVTQIINDGYLDTYDRLRGVALCRQSTDPTNNSIKGFVYTKSDSGDVELFYLDNSGNVVQVTKDGVVNLDIADLGSGTLAELNTNVSDATLFDISLLDDYATALSLATHIADVANPHEVTLDQSYDGSGSGAGRTITADSGPVIIDASGTDALNLDGYLSLGEISDPSALSNTGSIYTKDDSGDTELFYIDDSGNIVQLTLDGAVNAAASGNTLNQAYDQGGAGAGRTITADSGSVVINASGDEALSLDGYISLLEITDPAALGNTGTLYVKDDSGDSELYYRDDSGNIVQITQDGAVNAAASGNTLNQAYDQGGAGAGRLITADSGAVQINASGDEALSLDGYLSLLEISDPSALGNTGALYVKDDSGDTELYYIDNSGNITQITQDGYVNLAVANLDSGTLAELNSVISDATLADITLFDSYATSSALTTHTSDTTNPHEVTLDQSYDGNGSGAGRTITADNGAVVIDASGDEALSLDGYLHLTEISDPTLYPNSGSIYVKDDSSDTELYYMDDSGNSVQITKDGYVDLAVANLGSGTLAELNSVISDATLFDITLLDSYATSSELTTHTSDTTNPHEVTLDYAYDGSGSGSGRTITADSGAVIIDANGDDALNLDGYLSLNEITDPTALANKGHLYSKNDDEYNTSELFYMDDSGSITQITQDGYLATFNSLKGVGLYKQSGDPISSLDKGYLYLKDGVTNTELFYFDDAGNAIQITDDGYLVGTSVATRETNEPTGFPNVTDSTISFDDVSREFTIAPTSGTFYFYNKGVKVIKTSESVTIDDTSGLWYIKYNDSNILVASQTIWDFSQDVFVATVYWNSSDGYGQKGDERHGLTMDNATHEHFHDTIGSLYQSGFTLNGYTLDTATDNAVTVSIADGEFHDEDLHHVITNGSVGNYFEQPLVDPAQIPRYYRVGADGIWSKDVADNFFMKNYSAGNQLVAFNEYTGGVWQQTEVTSTNYTAYWIVAQNNPDEPIISIQGQSQDSTLSEAQENQRWENLSFGTFAFPEVCVLYRIIVRTRITYGNTPKCMISDIVDMRSVSTPVQGNFVATSHGALSDLSTSGHPASIISTDTTNFDGILDVNDTTVQAALETIDEFVNEPIRMVVQGADPSAFSPDGYLYTKSDSGDTELYYMDDSSNVVQVTKDGYVNLAVAYLGSGTLDELNSVISDATLADITLFDSYATTASLSSHTGDTTNPHEATLDQAYDGSGSGAGRTITADSSAVVIDASGDEALSLDGYLSLVETTDPTGLGNTGILYTKDDGTDTELFYVDDSSNVVQITKDGYVNLAVVNLDSGTLDELNSVISDATLADIVLFDSYATTTDLTTHTSDTTNSHEVTLDQAYDGSGAGAGRVITADSGKITINASGAGALELDGYLSLIETTDPTYSSNTGIVYTKIVDGYSELFYMDDYGTATQFTKDGVIRGMDAYESNLVSEDGSETSMDTVETPYSSDSITLARNGVLMRRVTGTPSGLNEFYHNGGSARVEFNAASEASWYQLRFNKI
jgi:hypothetical protein